MGRYIIADENASRVAVNHTSHFRHNLVYFGTI